MKRIDAMIEGLATEFTVSGSWGFCEYDGWNGRGFYHFRHPHYMTKITFIVSSECKSEERIRGLLKCELQRRWSRIGFRPGHNSWGEECLMFYDPNSFRHVVRQYIRTRDFKQARIA